MPNTLSTKVSRAVDKLDAQKKERFVQFYREHNGNITHACELTPIARQTYYTWLENDKQFFHAIEDARAELNDEMEQALIERGRVQGSDTAIIFYLKNRHPDYKPQPTTLIQNNTVITDKRKEYELE